MMSGAEMQYLVVEIWDKGRRVGGDELVGKCRLHLLRVKEHLDGEDTWHLLTGKDGRINHSRVRITLHKGIVANENPSISPPPPRLPQQHPMLSVVIPYSVKFQYTAAIKRGKVEVPLVQLFPPQSPMFDRLFLTLKKLNTALVLPTTSTFDDGTGETKLHNHVIPCREFLLEALGKVWLRLPGAAGGAVSSTLGSSNSSGGTVIVSSGGVRSTYWLGVLLLTTHRVIFISYPKAVSRKGEEASKNNVADERLNWLPFQKPGPNMPLCIPISEVDTSTVKKHWRERFTALEIIAKDSLGYIFAVERNNSEIFPEQSAINFMRRVKEELFWRSEEDSFCYRYDVIHSKNTEQPIRKAARKSLVLSKAHPHELSEVSRSRNDIDCNVCSVASSKSSKVFSHCPSCSWFICEDCLVAESKEKEDFFLVDESCEDMNEAIVRRGVGEIKAKHTRVSSPVNAYPTSLFASSPVRLPPMISSSPATGETAFSTNASIDGEKNKSSETQKAEKTKSLELLANDYDLLGLHEYPLQYPRTTTEDLRSEFTLSADFKRQRLDSFHAWRISEINDDYSICRTYPPIFGVPRCVSDEDLKIAAAQRSSSRLPVLTWIHPLTGASLCRASQPLVGITSGHCHEDEHLLKQIREATMDTRTQIKEESNIARGVYELVVSEQKIFQEGKSVMSGGANDFIDSVYRSAEKEIMNLAEPNGRTWEGQKEDKKVEEYKEEEDIALLSALYSDSESDREVERDSDEESWDGDDDDDDDDDGYDDDNLDDSLGEGTRVINPEQKVDNNTKLTRYDEVSNEMMNDFGITGLSISDTTLKDSNRSPRETKGLLRLSSNASSKSKSKKVTRLRILDARPLINAKGNALMGKGHEVIDHLGGIECATIKFANIENIHAMRTSYCALRSACSGAGGSCTSSGAGSNGSGSDWLQAVHDSKWLQHLSDLLKGAIYLACHLERGDPCLAHCSDGWDRTSQLTAITQLLLEPYYRSIVGFRDLVCKEFVWFGHRFRSRGKTGHGGEHVEYSPIFLQFLDCVFQVWRQMPWEFEFNDSLLLLLAYANASRHTIDFAFDSWNERQEEIKIREQIWYEETRACNDCWEIRTASKTQLINEAKLDQSSPGNVSFLSKKDRKMNISDLNSIVEVDENDDEIEIEEGHGQKQSHNIEEHDNRLGFRPSRIASESRYSALDILRQRAELDAASHGISPNSTPPRRKDVAHVDEALLTDKDLYCESCILRRSNVAVSIWDHVICHLSEYTSTVYAPSILGSSGRTDHGEVDKELCDDHGKILTDQTRTTSIVDAVDLCAYPLVTPTQKSSRASMGQNTIGKATLTCKTDFSGNSKTTPERDSMFTPPTRATHGTPTLFTRTAGKHDTLGGTKVRQEINYGGVSIIDESMTAVKPMDMDDHITSDVKSVLKSIGNPISSVKRSLNSTFAELGQEVGLDSEIEDEGLPDCTNDITRPAPPVAADLDDRHPSISQRPRISRPRCIRLLTPRINIQSLCVWEGLHMKSLPLGANNASSSVALQRSLEVALNVQKGRVAQLTEELDRLRAQTFANDCVGK